MPLMSASQEDARVGALDGGSILIIDDDSISLDSLREWLHVRLPNVSVTGCGRSYQACEMLHGSEYDVIIIHLRMLGLAGLAFVKEMKKSNPFACVIVVVSAKTPFMLVDALRTGTDDVLYQPLQRHSFVLSVFLSLQKAKLKRRPMSTFNRPS